MQLDDWISDDYLGRLNPKSEGAFPGRDDNDNGILFLAMMLMLVSKTGGFIDKDKVVASIRALEKERGLYHRRSISPDILEAHDNYVGICALSVLLGLPFAEDIVRYGEKTGYNFNNLNPGEYRLDCQRQGGDIGFYKLCAGYKCEPWYVVWMVGGLIVSALKSYPSSMNLGWLRFETLKLLDIKEPFTKWTIKIGQVIYHLINYVKGKNQFWAFANYFRKDHPIYLMGMELYGT